MELEQHQVPVDGIDQPGAADQGMDGADAAVGNAAIAVADLVADVARGEHRPLVALDVALVEAAFNPALALGQLSAYLGLHSKSFACRGV